MRLVQFLKNNMQRVGVEIKQNGDIIDLTKFCPAIANDMVTFLKSGEEGLNAAKKAVATGEPVTARQEVQILSPITNPEKLLCIGMNYKDHCEEIGAPIPQTPLVFSKMANCITHPGSNIIYPAISKQLDYEVELVAVIGKEGKHIEEKDALDYVVGFTVGHDVTARDLVEYNSGQFLLAKAFDTSNPLGPAIVTKDSIKDFNNLGIRCRVNSELRQNSNTKNMVFNISKCVSHISQLMTLKPGDIISTGTPPGVGCFRKPPIFLKVGDTIECEVDEIGSISNAIVADVKSNL